MARAGARSGSGINSWSADCRARRPCRQAMTSRTSSPIRVSIYSPGWLVTGLESHRESGGASYLRLQTGKRPRPRWVVATEGVRALWHLSRQKERLRGVSHYVGRRLHGRQIEAGDQLVGRIPGALDTDFALDEFPLVVGHSEHVHR